MADDSRIGLGIFLVMSLAAAIIGSLAYTETTIKSDTSSEIQAIQMGQGVINTAALANRVSTVLRISSSGGNRGEASPPNFQTFPP